MSDFANYTNCHISVVSKKLKEFNKYIIKGYEISEYNITT
jgi:hypothetical protein